MLNIQILGMGCSKCRDIEKNAKDIVLTNHLEKEVNIEVIEDIDVFFQHGILSTPALIINGKVIPNQHELTYEKLQQKMLNALQTLV